MKFYFLVITFLISVFSNSAISMTANNKRLALFLCRNCVINRVLPIIFSASNKLEHYKHLKYRNFENVLNRQYSSQLINGTQKAEKSSKKNCKILQYVKSEKKILIATKKAKLIFYHFLNISFAGFNVLAAIALTSCDSFLGVFFIQLFMLNWIIFEKINDKADKLRAAENSNKRFIEISEDLCPLNLLLNIAQNKRNSEEKTAIKLYNIKANMDENVEFLLNFLNSKDIIELKCEICDQSIGDTLKKSTGLPAQLWRKK